MFPPGAAQEEQVAQGVIWQAVIFWAALCYHLSLLASIEGETTSGASWQPGISVPDAPYRFRFCPSPPNAHDASALAALAAGQLMPTEAINWLSVTSAALFSLTGAFRNGSPDMPIIRTLLDQAAEKVDSPAFRKETGESSVAITPPDSVTPQESVLSVQTDDNLSSSPVELVASELMTSLNDNGGGDSQPPLNGVSTMELPEEQDNGSPGQEDADMLLSLFSAVADAEVTEGADDADVNTPATVAPDEMVPVGKDVPDEPAEREDAPKHNDTGADCLLPGTQGEPCYPLNVGAEPDDQARRFSPGCLTAWYPVGSRSISMIHGYIPLPALFTSWCRIFSFFF